MWAGWILTGGVLLHRHCARAPGVHDRVDDAPRLLGLVATDEQCRVAVEHVQDQVGVRGALRCRRLHLELTGLGASPAPRPATTETLTPRETEILALVAEGRTNGEIGKQLFISAKTVSVHVSNILGKLDAASRTEAAAIARRTGLL